MTTGRNSRVEGRVNEGVQLLLIIEEEELLWGLEITGEVRLWVLVIQEAVVAVQVGEVLLWVLVVPVAVVVVGEQQPPYQYQPQLEVQGARNNNPLLVLHHPHRTLISRPSERVTVRYGTTQEGGVEQDLPLRS